MEQNLLGLVKRAGAAVRRAQDELVPDSNGKGHGRLLRLIAEHEGISGKELALMMGLRPSTLTEKLNLLEQEGAIRRSRDTKDRRVVRVALTPKGFLALERRESGIQALQKALDETMTREEQQQFCLQCQKIIQNMERVSAFQKQGAVIPLEWENTPARKLSGSET